MPCYNGREEEDRANQKKRLDEVTEHLCYVMNALDKTAICILTTDNPFLGEWWKQHQEFDKTRKNE